MTFPDAFNAVKRLVYELKNKLFLISVCDFSSALMGAQQIRGKQNFSNGSTFSGFSCLEDEY